ncbi:hypothetical protein [Mycobacterium sp. 48b]|uniref:hypothetical protein n=1 Tax=Mycobacterium sp. 48b TaxID=3400426 RepID=UPI003AAF222E
MSVRYLQHTAIAGGAAIVPALVASCGSGKPMQNIEEDVTIPQMTIGETVTGGPRAPAGDKAPTAPPTSPETPKATPPQVAVPH